MAVRIHIQVCLLPNLFTLFCSARLLSYQNSPLFILPALFPHQHQPTTQSATTYISFLKMVTRDAHASLLILLISICRFQPLPYSPSSQPCPSSTFQDSVSEADLTFFSLSLQHFPILLPKLNLGLVLSFKFRSQIHPSLSLLPLSLALRLRSRSQQISWFPSHPDYCLHIVSQELVF